MKQLEHKFIYTALSGIFAILILTGCWSSETNPPCDIYEVNVRTTLNLRSRPDKTSEVVGRYRRGDIVKVCDVTDNGWAAVYNAGRVRGYASMDYLTLVEKHRDAESQSKEQEEDNHYKDSLSEKDPAGLLDASKEVGDEDGVTKGNVTIDDEYGILRPDQRKYIVDALSQRKGYTFIITTSKSIEKGKILDHGSEMLSQFSDLLDAGISWWTRVKSWLGGELPSSNLIVISYVDNLKLLQAGCNGVAMKYVQMKEPDKYFNIQKDAVTGEISKSIARLGNLIADGGEDYSKRSWPVRVQINTGDILDGIIDGLLANNILPSDSRWHKWLFGWIFAVPFAFANWLFRLCGSYLLTMFAFMGIYLLSQYIFASTLKKDASIGGKAIGCLFFLPKLFLWISFLTLVVYMSPKMDTVVDMQQYGYNNGLIEDIRNHFANDNFGKPWWIIVIFILSMMFVKGVDSDFAIMSRIKPSFQQNFARNSQDKLQSLMAKKGIDTDIKKFKTRVSLFHLCSMTN